METIIQLPLYVASNFRSYTGGWGRSTACSIYLYGLSIQAIMVCSHALITINRVWAVSGSITYQNHHFIRVSTCIIMCSNLVDCPLDFSSWFRYRCVTLSFAPSLRLFPQQWSTIQLVHCYAVRYFQKSSRCCYFALSLHVHRLHDTSEATRTRGFTYSSRNVPNSSFAKTARRGTREAGEVSNNLQSPTRRHSKGFLLLTILTAAMFLFWMPGHHYIFHGLLVREIWLAENRSSCGYAKHDGNRSRSHGSTLPQLWKTYELKAIVQTFRSIELFQKRWLKHLLYSHWFEILLWAFCFLSFTLHGHGSSFNQINWSSLLRDLKAKTIVFSLAVWFPR